jgi:ABC-type bacteriocin/lantibiotic exporter with double-glycine peptidase domain
LECPSNLSNHTSLKEILPPPKKAVFVVGKMGSGKSTVVRRLTGKIREISVP